MEVENWCSICLVDSFVAIFIVVYVYIVCMTCSFLHIAFLFICSYVLICTKLAVSIIECSDF